MWLAGEIDGAVSVRVDGQKQIYPADSVLKIESEQTSVLLKIVDGECHWFKLLNCYINIKYSVPVEIFDPDFDVPLSLTILGNGCLLYYSPKNTDTTPSLKVGSSFFSMVIAFFLALHLF